MAYKARQALVQVVRIMSNLRKVLKSKLSPQPKTLVNTEVDHDSSVTQVNEEEERCHDITEVIQGSWSHADEKAVYESQMTLLQEQLVAAMIEHQALGENST
ncbi:hypothetical protein CAPTEDRAFT_208376 [Capitella teleta]|uniref:Uncharacterized protein n=1 Tax=Capitella teleta TaxID=283909 RepID=R7TMQ5_CAPTE|nr:hypothetical protein CAPTEDRAFT_208376 [Capitella teleta]|eukprot:ELT94792.1 hypothetical protein CAPTEDRAFT_208376 [Capitella teleta]